MAGEQVARPNGQACFSGTAATSGGKPTDYGFTGQRADAATGLDYYNARYYDPVAGQFASADTTLAGGLNRYAYVGDNPVNWTDPSGHCDNIELCVGEFDPMGGVPATTDEGGTLGRMKYGDGEDTAPINPDAMDTTVAAETDGNLAEFRAEGDPVEVTYAEVTDGENFFRDVHIDQPTAQPPAEPPTPPGGSAGQGASGGDAPPGGQPPSAGAPSGGTIVPEDVYRFGASPNGPNAANPVSPKPGDYDLNPDGTVQAQTPPSPKGVSTYIDPARTTLTGHYYRLPAGTQLPGGLDFQADGADVGGGGDQPWGHRTLYPTRGMPLDEFNSLIDGLPWSYAGRIR